MTAKGKAYVGTSGWSYDHWAGLFYPHDLRKQDWLAFYMQHFNTVEINNTFYHLPTPHAFMEWKDSATPGFIYALKGSRFITHLKKLNITDEPLQLFLDGALLLRDSLGPVLFQLPPRWRCNPERLNRFVKMLPSGVRFAFEFRDPTWFNDAVYDILRERDIALCAFHMPDFVSPVEATARFAYIRFHGTDFLYGGRYTRQQLALWADLIRLYLAGGMDVYVYFNNDAAAHAVINARELMESIEMGI